MSDEDRCPGRLRRLHDLARIVGSIGERLFHQDRDTGLQHLLGHGAVCVVWRGQNDPVTLRNQLLQGLHTRQRIISGQTGIQNRRQRQVLCAFQRVNVATAHKPRSGQSNPFHAPASQAATMPRNSASPRIRPISG